MPSFFKAFRSNKDGNSKAKSKTAPQPAQPVQPQKPRWDDAWTRTKVAPEEVRELLHICSSELKSRDLELPFLLLPFRPNADASAAKNFIRSYFAHGEGPSSDLTASKLQREARLMEPLVLCSIIKWCWARLPGGVVGWDVFQLFRTGEIEANMAKDSFDVFIPLSVDSDARKNIIFDFFDLLAAISANGKTNGLGGRKLSRLAGWWAFEHDNEEAGFDGGYASWARSADACSHMFFAYLRARAPDDTAGSSGISQLPRSLLALLSQTEYPPETPSLLHRTTSKVVMIVERVSPTPYALLQRANTFDYQDLGRDADPVLVRFGDTEDAVDALTFESRRVLDAISSTNASSQVNHHTRLGNPQGGSDWSRFEDIGFSSLLDGPQENGSAMRGGNFGDRMRTHPANGGRNELDRPTTPSWADFLSSGFADDGSKQGTTNMLSLPSDKMLPPITPPRVQSSQSHVRHGLKSDNLDAPELNATSRKDIDETFWWVWMTSLAGEEPAERKSVFGRCAFVETEPKVTGGGWLVLEEQVKGAAAPLKEDVKIVEKKSRFTFGRKNRQRRGSTGKKPPPTKFDAKKAASASSPALARKQPTPDQESKIHLAAAQMVQKQQEGETMSTYSRRGRQDEDAQSRTQSVLTLGSPMAMDMKRDAGPAMQWAHKFDKDAIRERYLGDPNLGVGSSVGSPRAPSMASTMDLISMTKFDGSKQRGSPHGNQLDGLAALSGAESNGHRTTSSTADRSEQAPPPLPKDDSPVSPATPRASESKQHQHQISGTTVSPEDMNHTTRKPVASMDKGPREQDHPAFRKSNDQKRANGAAASPMTAAAAASAAMKNSNARQAQQAQQPAQSQPDGLQKSKTGSTRKFKSLFSRGKKEEDDGVPEALRMQRAISAKNKGQLQNNTLRKPPPVPSKQEPHPEAIREESPATQPGAHAARPEADDGEPGPEVETGPPAYAEDRPSYAEDRPSYAEDRPSYADDGYNRDSVADSDQANRSTAHFSNFTQGPLEEQPAFAADEYDNDDGERAPGGYDEHPHSEHPHTEHPHAEHTHSEHPHHEPQGAFQTSAAQRLFQNSEPQQQPGREEFATPMEANPNDEAEHGLADDEPEEYEGHHPAPPSNAPPPVPTESAQDRWAQIRKNAADRRTEPPAHASRTSQSNATEKTDDGETSGEESIESRVARIRARVAQLTGNQQEGGAPHS